MTLLAPFNRFGFTVDNLGTLLTSVGTSVVPGASNVEGTYTKLIAGSAVTRDLYAIHVQIHGGATSATAKDHVLDIGIIPNDAADSGVAGSVVSIISDVICGYSGAVGTAGPRSYYFPIWIPTNASIWARVQGSAATAGTVRVGVVAWGAPSHPEHVWVGQVAETIGTVTNTLGVTIVPGASNAYGSWTSLGTTVRPLKWWQLALQCTNTVINTSHNNFQLSYGDGTTYTTILPRVAMSYTTAEDARPTFGEVGLKNAFCDVPAGATMYCRGYTSLVTPDTTWNAVAIGIG